MVAAYQLTNLVTSSIPDSITLESLLNEMINRDLLPRLPSPAYLCHQFSSYNRRSVTPTDPDGWFAGGDSGHFLHTERIQGRDEWVLMDHRGPGCVVRIWAPDVDEGQIMRFYLDGKDEPAIEARMIDLVTGADFIGPPFAYTSVRAGNLYLPIPYAASCKVTVDKKPFYYHINYRAYEEGTRVRSFTMDEFEAAKETVRRVGEHLAAPVSFCRGDTANADTTIEPGESVSVPLPPGPAAVRTLQIRVLAPNSEQALRSTVLGMECDGERTIWCPVGDFYGNGVGLNPYQDWYRTVRDDGEMSCRWIMPYEKSAQLTVCNLHQDPVKLQLAAHVGAWHWDDRSMHFHANWRQQCPIPTLPCSDWNYITIDGQGVYVGDTLAVMNPEADWWGEGDEKIWVDGEEFPSHFGTGTEDYYGYAYGGASTDLYQKPFHAQVRCGQKATFGQNTQTRTRSLDAIPFNRRLQMDMEVQHHVSCNVGYAAATYWYARPNAASNRGDSSREAARQIPEPEISEEEAMRKSKRWQAMIAKEKSDETKENP